MSAAIVCPLKFQIGARTLLSVRRRLVRVPLSLEEVLAGAAPALPPLDPTADGYLIDSLRSDLMQAVSARADGLRPFIRQAYVRRYADLSGGFEAYLAHFSGKSRSTLLRKVRRFAQGSRGALDARLYRTPAELETFLDMAREVSRRSYQERLLGAGLPRSAADREAMLALAAQDRVRAFLLFQDSRPASYLYLSAEGRTLLYAYLGFDPSMADLSPGTVLQFEATRMLMEEGHFVRLDFTEGDGAHKKLFATGGVECVDLMLLRRSPGNLLATSALAGFDRGVAIAKRLADRPTLRPLTRMLRR